MFFCKFFKKIFIIYLVISLTLFSPVVFSALPALAVPAGVVLGAVAGDLGKKVLKKIVKELGGDDDTIVIRDNYVYYNDGSQTCTFNSYANPKSPYHTNGNKISANSLYLCTAEHSWRMKTDERYYESMKKEGFLINTRPDTGSGFCSVREHSNGNSYAIGSYNCQGKPKELTPEDVLNEIKKRADKQDKDAQDLLDEIKKKAKQNDDDSSNDDKDKKDKDKSDDDSSDKDKSDDDKDKDKKDKDKSDDDDDTSSDDECKAKKDDDDDAVEKCKDDEAKDKDKDDDETCSSSAFHKKVCEWIDWTYDETDKAKKKIAEFFSDDEINDIDKKKLNELVDETDVALKKSDFDVIDACPAPKSVSASFLGRTVEIEVFNFQGICKYAGFIEFALQTTATIIGINIIAGRRME